MKGLRIFGGLLILVMFVQPAMAQRRDLTAQADKVFEIGEYFKAIEKYKKAYNKEKDKLKKTEITFRIAQCYLLVNDNRKAESYFSRVVRRKYSDPKVYLLYGEVQDTGQRTRTGNRTQRITGFFSWRITDR